MKPMTREEAILQMNLLEHTFFAFRDEDNTTARLQSCTREPMAAMASLRTRLKVL